MRQKRDPPSNEPEQDMQTWREFRAWGIVVKDSRETTNDDSGANVLR